jgi:hypothetical protein
MIAAYSFGFSVPAILNTVLPVSGEVPLMA